MAALLVFLATALRSSSWSLKTQPLPGKARLRVASGFVLSRFLFLTLVPTRKQKPRQPLLQAVAANRPRASGFRLQHPCSTRRRLALRSLRSGRKPFVPHSLHPSPQRLLRAVFPHTSAKRKRGEGKVCFWHTKSTCNRPAVRKKREAENDNFKLCKMVFYVHKK